MKRAIPLLFIMSVLFGCHASEADLRDNFVTNRETFKNLVEMLNHDREIKRLTHNHVFYETATKELPEARIKEYRQLLKTLDINDGISRDNRSVYLLVSSTGPFAYASNKGYMYSTDIPEPLVDSVDNYVSLRKQPPIYQKIEDNWYLVYECW